MPGGGAALYHAGVALEKWEITGEIELEVRQAMISTLENPIRQLIENAQRSPTQILSEILKSTSANSGFDITTNKIEDLVARGG